MSNRFDGKLWPQISSRKKPGKANEICDGPWNACRRGSVNNIKSARVGFHHLSQIQSREHGSVQLSEFLRTQTH